MKQFLTFLVLSLSLVSISFAKKLIIQNDATFLTSHQMLLANEMNESGEPFAEFLGYNLDDLNPMSPNFPDTISYTLGIENYEYSRYLLGALGASSGLGLHMMWSPLINQMSTMEPVDFDGKYTGNIANGYKEDDEFMKVMMHFSMLANQMPPTNPFPQFADFISGDMTLPQAVTMDFQMDYASLRFDRSKMDKTLNLAAMGQSMMKQYLWAQDMLGAFHDSDDNTLEADGTISPDSVDSPNFDPNNNVFYGGNNIDGLMGQILTATGISKTMFVLGSLAFDGDKLGMIDPLNYNPANKIIYFPHKIQVVEKSMGDMLPPKAESFSVSDKSSHLFDQISFLRATVGFQNMMNPDVVDSKHFAYARVFDGNPFPATMKQTGVMGPYDMMMGISMVLFQNIMAMHFDASIGSFVDISNLDENSKVLHDNTISAENVAYTIITLVDFINEFSGTPLATMANDALLAQANFIINSLKDKNNVYHNQFIIGQGVTDEPTTLSSLSSIIQSLYKVYSFTNDTKYLNEANNAYLYLIKDFYIEQSSAFRTKLNDNQAVYTPFNLATLSGAMREASIIGNQEQAPLIYSRVFKNVYNSMILAEAQQSGETGNDSDSDGVPYIVGANHPYTFAAEGTLELSSPSDVAAYNFSEIPIHIFPNPSSAILNIEMTSIPSENLKVSLLDITGREIRSEVIGRTNAIQFDVTGLSSGIYFVRIYQDGLITKVEKIIIDRNR